MVEMDRRSLLVGAAASTLLPLQSASALSPLAGTQAAGLYRYKVGAFECTSINDGAITIPIPDGFVRNVSKDEALVAAEAAYMPKGKVTVPFNPQLINTGSKLVLIDTGNGPSANPSVGHLLANLKVAGVDPKDVDIVLLSHLHPDHINGLRLADGSLAFPNAEIKAPNLDWAFWMSDENQAKAQDKPLMKTYFATIRKTFSGLENKVTRYDWDKEVAPGITSIEAAGHTPGHTAFAIASGDARILIQSDVTNIPEFFLRHPDWQVMFDNDPEQAIKTRKKFYDMAAAEKALIVGFHFPFPSIGHVEKTASGYQLIPVAWNPVL